MSSDDERRRRFESVAADVYEPLQRYLRRRANAADAADVLSDALLVVWRRLDDVPEDPVPWTIGVARRCLANHRRATTRQLRLVQKAARHLRRDEAGDPLDAAERSDPELAAALDGLSDAEAEIVRLWAWEQLEPREIAVALELTPNAVSVALHRAKRKLADALDAPPRGPGRQIAGDAGHFRSTGTTQRGEVPDA